MLFAETHQRDNRTRTSGSQLTLCICISHAATVLPCIRTHLYFKQAFFKKVSFAGFPPSTSGPGKVHTTLEQLEVEKYSPYCQIGDFLALNFHSFLFSNSTIRVRRAFQARLERTRSSSSSNPTIHFYECSNSIQWKWKIKSTFHRIAFKKWLHRACQVN